MAWPNDEPKYGPGGIYYETGLHEARLAIQPRGPNRPINLAKPVRQALEKTFSSFNGAFMHTGRKLEKSIQNLKKKRKEKTIKVAKIHGRKQQSRPSKRRIN